jgi:hypothetical protein
VAEKLYKCNCSVPGHGSRCEAARDKKKDKKSLSKLRRRINKKICRKLKEEIE